MGLYKNWQWLLSLTLFWPIAHLAVFTLRFGRLPVDIVIDAIVFLPMGFVSALFFVLLRSRAQTPHQKWAILIGYVVAIPLAGVGSLVSGLLLPPLIGTVIFGVVPLLVGMGLSVLIMMGLKRFILPRS